MRDVAARAGVSLKTVSRVVNGEAHVRPEIQAKVDEAIAFLRWRPNPAARALRSGKTGIIAVAVPSLTHPFNARLTEAVVSDIAWRGLQADVTPSPSGSQVSHIIASVGRSADAVVLIDLPVDASVADGAPVVSLMSRLPAIDSVLPDLGMAASIVSKHSAVLDRHHPLVVGCDRFEGYEDLLRSCWHKDGIDQMAEPIQMVSTRADGYVITGQILDGDRPDVIVAGSDDIALGLLAGLTEAGLRVPQDVAVIGFDNLEDDMFSYPSLTSLDSDPGLLSRIALDRIGERIEGLAGAPRVDEVPVTLIRRESTLGIGTL